MTKMTIQDHLQQDNKTLGSLLHKLAQIKHWNQIIRDCLGDEAHIMDHCQIVNLSGNSLIAITDSPHWLTRLRFHIPDLLPKLRQHKGLEHIKALCCKAQPGMYHGKLKKPRRNRLMLKPDTANLILENAQKIKDEKIKAILERIASYTDT